MSPPFFEEFNYKLWEFLHKRQQFFILLHQIDFKKEKRVKNYLFFVLFDTFWKEVIEKSVQSIEYNWKRNTIILNTIHHSLGKCLPFQKSFALYSFEFKNHLNNRFLLQVVMRKDFRIWTIRVVKIVFFSVL